LVGALNRQRGRTAGGATMEGGTMVPRIPWAALALLGSISVSCGSGIIILYLLG
jgi:hypothetical protein